MGYWYLSIAILCEVLATSALKESQGLTQWLPALVSLVGYGFAFYYLALTLEFIPVGVSYAIWSGAGIVLIALIGHFYYGEYVDGASLIGMAFIIAGIGILRFYSHFNHS